MRDLARICSLIALALGLAWPPHPQAWAAQAARAPDLIDSLPALGGISQATPSQIAAALDLPAASVIGVSLGQSDPRAIAVAESPLLELPRAGRSFVILSTGLASAAALPNSSGSLSAILEGQNNSQGHDLTQLTLTLRPPEGAGCLSLEFIYLSEEFPEYVGSRFNDAFTAELGTSLLQISGDEVVAPGNFAFDAAANPISVNTTVGVSPRPGTTYDGSTGLLQARHPVAPGRETTLTLTVQDLGDSVYDSAVFIDSLAWLPPGNCQAGGQLPPPVILVHGYNGLSETDLTCAPGAFRPGDVVRYREVQAAPTTAVRYWGAFPIWLSGGSGPGYDVWVAQLQSGREQGTPGLLSNSLCLADQIAYVASRNPQPITIIAHSMGGLVARLAMARPGVAANVRALYTLGTPHAGVEAVAWRSQGLDTCRSGNQPAQCDMSPYRMPYFNAMAPNQPGLRYVFIGGDASPAGGAASITAPGGGVAHDGLVATNSALGFLPDGEPAMGGPAPLRIRTGEVHGPTYRRAGAAGYMERADGQAASISYLCFAALEAAAPLPAACRAEQPAPTNEALATAAGPLAATAPIRGQLPAGGAASHSLPIDSGAAGLTIALSGDRDGLQLALVRPDGLRIDGAYASSHPDEVELVQAPGGATAPMTIYRFLRDQPAGPWTALVSAGGASGRYRLEAQVAAPAYLSATLGQPSHLSGAELQLRALVSGAPGAPASVVAQIAHADGSLTSVELAGQGGGWHQAAVQARGIGTMRVEVQARGDGWSRQALAEATILPRPASLTAAGLTARNQNGDQLIERVDAELSVSGAHGLYALVAQLYSGETLVAQSVADAQIGEAGLAAVGLDGNQIRLSRRPGPYRARLSLVDRATGLPALAPADGPTIAGGWADFGGCATLSLAAVPAGGGRVLADPAPNCAGGTQYSVDTTVRISGLPAPGYILRGWQGAVGGGPAPELTLTIAGDGVAKAIFVPGSRVHLPLTRR